MGSLFKNHLFLGCIPLFAAIYTSAVSISQGKAAEILWVCNICNVILAIGLFTRHSMTIRVATLWLIIGTPLWIWDNLARGIYFTAHAFVIHIIGALIGIYAIRSVKHTPTVWKQALIFGIALQLITRFTAPAELNINVSATVYEPLQAIFPNYYYYMMFNAVCFSFGLILLEKLLLVFSNMNRTVKVTD